VAVQVEFDIITLSDLELTATCRIKLRLSLFSNQDLKLICFLPLSANYSIYLFRQSLCSRPTALWRYINFVLLLLLLIGLSSEHAPIWGENKSLSSNNNRPNGESNLTPPYYACRHISRINILDILALYWRFRIHDLRWRIGQRWYSDSLAISRLYGRRANTLI